MFLVPRLFKHIKQIADQIGLERTNVSRKLSDIEKMCINPISEEYTYPEFIKEYHKKCVEFTPFLYNVWNVSSMISKNHVSI